MFAFHQMRSEASQIKYSGTFIDMNQKFRQQNNIRSYTLMSSGDCFMNYMIIIAFNEKCQIVELLFFRHLVLIVVPDVTLLVLESNPASVDKGLLDAVTFGVAPLNRMVDQTNQEEYDQQELKRRTMLN